MGVHCAVTSPQHDCTDCRTLTYRRVLQEEKAYGSCLPYQMAAPLMEDMMQQIR